MQIIIISYFMNFKKNKCYIFILLFITSALFAEEKAVNRAHELSLEATSQIEFKLRYTNRFFVPFLKGESPLTEGNNIELVLGGELSPVSLDGFA